MAKLVDIEGIGEKYAAQLAAGGVKTQADLLAAGKDPKGRKAVAEASGVSEKLILKWVNRADLARIKGIGEEYADLLECSGVDTVPDLATRNAANLHAKMTEVNAEKKLVRALPRLEQVENWVQQAKTMDRAVHY
jgi:predicted flap endonuclease-1-like 5' DNA nuclease